MGTIVLQNLYKNHAGIKKILSSFLTNEENIYLKGLSGSAGSLICCSLFTQTKDHNWLCILNNEEEAGYFYYDCCQIIGEKKVMFFPSQFKRSIRYGHKDDAFEILRTEALTRLNSQKYPYVLVSYPEALSERIISPDRLRNSTLTIHKQEKISSLFVTEILQTYGFKRVDYVYEPGQYSVRGSIIDVFSYSNELPYRIDFFGNEIESIRSFEVETQLSKKKLTAISILSTQSGHADTTLFAYLPKTTKIVVKKEEWIYEKIHSLWDDIKILEETDSSSKQIESSFISGKTIRQLMKNYTKIHLNNSPTPHTKSTIVEFATEPQLSYHKNFDLITSSLEEKSKFGYILYLLSNNENQIKRIQSILDRKNHNFCLIPICCTLHAGFMDKTLQIGLFTDHQLFDRFHKYSLKSDKARFGKMALSLKELKQFQLGDYLVHIDHGIGKFGGLICLEINGKKQEVIKMIFLSDDIIFVSIHNLHKISKYKGNWNESPKLNKLGSGAWESLKERTKKKVKGIAKDLIQLYSKRREEKGFSFSPDTYLQKELEASFLYEDTPDQIKATMEIKKDMESGCPMDRLVCADVGFGKTEVAIRAAFKAITDNKQVAILVPTTPLAFQHYNTFKERLKNFPATVEYISRARKTRETTEILQNLKEGKIDILIGTHRVISKDVQFKDLGLLIVDEEQKFGVNVKEKLKQIKTNVDSLTLTATPIPRTLQFSLMGARDLSNVSTPPPNRYPIHTELHRFGRDIIKEAIHFEMSRNGQIFIINNHIPDLKNLENLVKKEIPEARVAIGHGKMNSSILEQMIIDFANYEYDILISTTIIENGIDIPNANTIIINNAHTFGLSDLHQLRGRVGRSNRKAFCYLLSPPLSCLPPEAVRRLQAIENFSELGSGIHIAIKDLDIRGAGNMFGAEQSGFIANLGYETYQKILSEAVQELKNEEFADLYKNDQQIDFGNNYVLETYVESDLEIYFPSSYIPNDSERILMYRELDIMEEETEIEQFRIKLLDRFGKIPSTGEELLRIVSLRRMAKKIGIEKIVLKGGKMNLHLIHDFDSPYYQSITFDKLLKFVKNHSEHCRILEKNNRRMVIFQKVETVEKAVKMLKEVDP